jgi:peptidoglycan/xylan/chitin deacetylase (PgdA/CDA1 family)
MVKVLVSIDTEEDDWGSYAPSGATVENIGRLPEVHALLRRHGARPTYFVNRPPLVEASALGVLQELARDPASEIGAHCHPWNTPPLEGPGGVASSMMCNLPRAVNRGKVLEITRLIEEGFGARPRSFRAGRWGLGPTVAEALVDLGYEVDSSVSPFIDWSPHGGADYGRVPVQPYRFDARDPLRPRAEGALVEVPISIGALRGHAVRAARASSRLEHALLARLGLVGVLDRMGVFARRWLSPESSTAAEMVRLSDNLVRSGVGVLHLTFHSCTLLPGATPFVQSADEADAFLRRIDEFLAHCVSRGWGFATVGEAAASLGKGGAVAR